MPMRRELNQDFFKRWSPEMAYVLGFFAADGSMVKNKRGGCYIEFTITDRIVLECIKRVTGSEHKITGRKRGGNRKTAYRLQIGSKEWFTDLARLGFMQNKSKRMTRPPIPQRYLGDFVRGYFDGDGCVYFRKLKYADRKNKRWVLLTVFTSGSFGFLESLREAVRSYGITGGSLGKKKRGFDLKFSHHDSIALCELMYHNSQTSDLYLPRKRTKLRRAIRVLQLK